MKHHEVEKYRRPVRIIHWIHSGAFVVLFLTGLLLFIPGLAFLAEHSWIHIAHRAAATIFIAVPAIYLMINPAAVGRGLKQAFTWGAEDLGWLKAAPRYYLLGDEKSLTPQDWMNSGQKMWWLITVVFGLVSVISGLTMWFGKTDVSPALLRWIVFSHDIAFILTGALLFLHIYLGVFHPKMTEAWKSMVNGKISIEYAKKHHGKWYERISKG
jgi:formate dehydrogenase subunit gamma